MFCYVYVNHQKLAAVGNESKNVGPTMNQVDNAKSERLRARQPTTVTVQHSVLA